MSSPAYYLVLVGTLDNPLYESTLASSKSGSLPATQQATSPVPPTSFSIFGAQPPSGARGEVGYNASGGAKGEAVMQLVAHASLDVVEDVMWSNGGMYLKAIDKFHEWSVSSWLTPGGVKIILLHSLKNDDGIRLFLQEVWELYARALLNPFHELNAPLRSAVFDQRVKASARKHL